MKLSGKRNKSHNDHHYTSDKLAAVYGYFKTSDGNNTPFGSYLWETSPPVPPSGYDRNFLDELLDNFENSKRCIVERCHDAFYTRHRLSTPNVKIGI